LEQSLARAGRGADCLFGRFNSVLGRYNSLFAGFNSLFGLLGNWPDGLPKYQCFGDADIVSRMAKNRCFPSIIPRRRETVGGHGGAEDLKGFFMDLC
jgi:hypothetical protein